jgi:hypothetical protein
MTTAFVIEKNIPIPQAQLRVRQSKWKALEIGDSVFFAGKKSGKFGGTVSGARKVTGYTFTQRQVEGGVRVWRTA